MGPRFPTGSAELHAHFSGSVAADDLLRHLASAEEVLWDCYETKMLSEYDDGPNPKSRGLTRLTPDSRVFEIAPDVLE